MLKNYLKLAWRILWRKKFFTFISLFGISFTLAILMIFISILQTELSDNPPMGNAEDLVYITSMSMKKQYYDTIPVIDSALVDGIMQFDTTQTTSESGQSITTSDMSSQALQNYLNDIPSVQKNTIIAVDKYDVFVNNSKINVEAVFTDHNYWSVFNFEFTEGRPFDESEVEKNNPVMVVTKDFAMEYFGQEQNVVGKSVEMDGKKYDVIGVVKTPALSKSVGYSVARDVFVPHSLLPEGYSEDFYFGGFHAVYHKKDAATIDEVVSDIQYAAEQIPLDHPDNKSEFNELEIRPASIKATLAQQLYYEEDPNKSLTIMTIVMFSLLSLFILLPMLNLINLNVSRIMDRASEIGVRKAFGAANSNILSQFVFENVVLTLLGGVIALLLAITAITLINQSKVLGNTHMSFDGSFFFASLCICLIFGILSGIIPAYKMSNLNIVDALKQNKI